VIRDLQELYRRDFDLVVIGGGAYGACAALDAATRGMSVALVEQDDFCSATSANHLKIVHGGIRYLQHLDLRRVRASSRERSALLRIAPHLVQPLPILMPTYGRGVEGRSILRAGFSLYDLTVADRNVGIRDPGRQIPRTRLLSRDRCLELCPKLEDDDLTGAGLFYEAQFYNPPRLVLAFLRSAVDAGACIANYVEATGFLREDATVRGIRVRDHLTGNDFDIRGHMVLNCTGPWAPRLLGSTANTQFDPPPTFSRDTGFVLRGHPIGDHALACRIRTKDPDAIVSRKGRHIFLVPWRDYTLVGVWHSVTEERPEDVNVSTDEISIFLEEINAVQPGLALHRDDVSMVYTGLTLFGENEPGQKDLRFGHRSLLIDHSRYHGVAGLLSLVGVRATMARGMAEKAVDLAREKLGMPSRPSQSAVTPVYGGDIDHFEDFVHAAVREHRHIYRPEVVRALIHNYGSEYKQVMCHADASPSLASTFGESTTLKAEVIHALREEMAQTLCDIVFRRTDLGTGGKPGEAILEQCAALAATEMHWNDRRRQEELANVRSRFPQ